MISKIVALTKDRFSTDIKSLDSPFKPFWCLRESLHVVDGDILMYGDRVVIPPSLKECVLKVLHSVHQGISGMEARAQALVFWPGITNDIKRMRDECETCCKNAPSQPAALASAPSIPSTSFESVFADFFDVSNFNYLIVGDKLSGWVEVFSSKVGSSQSGARGLIAHLRTLFGTFGVPEELSSDGGPEFTATTSQHFFKNCQHTSHNQMAAQKWLSRRLRGSWYHASDILAVLTQINSSKGCCKFVTLQIQTANYLLHKSCLVGPCVIPCPSRIA